LLAGANTLDFRINNAPAMPNPTGLRVNLRGLLDFNLVSPPWRCRLDAAGTPCPSRGRHRLLARNSCWRRM
jgi:hypothetical protein